MLDVALFTGMVARVFHVLEIAAEIAHPHRRLVAGLPSMLVNVSLNNNKIKANCLILT